MSFGKHTLVFEVCSKMFLLIAPDSNATTLRRKSKKAVELRRKHSGATPYKQGVVEYHSNEWYDSATPYS